MYVPFHDISDDEFEWMVFLICRHILGEGAQYYSKGKDGGIDVYFEGVAEKLKPISGKCVVQAKHSNSPFSSCSESNFFSESGESSVIHQEVVKIKNLYDEGMLDYYLLFTNRVKSAMIENKIRKYISSYVGIPLSNVRIFAYDEIAAWHAEYEDVGNCVEFPSINRSLDCSIEEMIEIVNEFISWSQKEEAQDKSRHIPTQIQRESFKEKNKVNDIDKDESDFLLRHYFSHEANIREMLAVPSREDVRKLYEVATIEIQRKILGYMHKGHNFMEAFNQIIDSLMRYNIDLKRNKIICESILFFMYFNCDIGRRCNCYDCDEI